jgi:hypothetical protein
MCGCQKTGAQNTHALVPNFAAAAAGGEDTDLLARGHATLTDVKYLALQTCVSATYSSGTNQICFSIPIYGNVCFTPPVSIPVNASISACAQTCTHWGIPTGLQATVYLNGTAIWSKTFGSC